MTIKTNASCVSPSLVMAIGFANVMSPDPPAVRYAATASPHAERSSGDNPGSSRGVERIASAIKV